MSRIIMPQPPDRVTRYGCSCRDVGNAGVLDTDRGGHQHQFARMEIVGRVERDRVAAGYQTGDVAVARQQLAARLTWRLERRRHRAASALSTPSRLRRFRPVRRTAGNRCVWDVWRCWSGCRISRTGCRLLNHEDTMECERIATACCGVFPPRTEHRMPS